MDNKSHSNIPFSAESEDYYELFANRSDDHPQCLKAGQELNEKPLKFAVQLRWMYWLVQLSMVTMVMRACQHGYYGDESLSLE